MAAEYQFRLCKDSPSKEAAFSQLKEKYGSQFLFHGSPFYNWHSILQDGLKHAGCNDLASSQLCIHQGIFLAENSGTSAGYCVYRDNSGFPAYPSSIFGQSPWCIALCEVINEYSTSERYSGVRVEKDADKVIARYLFVFPSNDSIPNSSGPAIPYLQAANLYGICEKHAKKQAAILDAIKKASQDLHQHWGTLYLSYPWFLHTTRWQSSEICHVLTSGSFCSPCETASLQHPISSLGDNRDASL